MQTCAVHGTTLKEQNTKWGVRWSCPEDGCDQVTWHANQPTASQDVRDAIKYLMEDLKAAVVIGSQDEYVNELYSSIGMQRPSTVRIESIREHFREYDSVPYKQATLVEIVLQLKPITTPQGFATHKSITRYLKAIELCTKHGAEQAYRSQMKKFLSVDLQEYATKSDVWLAFTVLKKAGAMSPDEAMDNCEWMTRKKAWDNYTKTGTPGDPIEPKKGKLTTSQAMGILNSLGVPKDMIGTSASNYSSNYSKGMLPKYDPFFSDTPVKAMTQTCKKCHAESGMHRIVCDNCGTTFTVVHMNPQQKPVKKKKVDPRSPVVEGQAEVVDLKPKRKFNFED